MIPQAHFGKGKYFGELALQDNKENPLLIPKRAGTLQCMTECVFATMTKVEYQQALEYADLKYKERLIEFFRTVPYLKNLTKVQLTRTVNSIQKVSHLRGQQVCKEGCPANQVYIIAQGEYEISKLGRMINIDDPSGKNKSARGATEANSSTQSLKQKIRSLNNNHSSNNQKGGKTRVRLAILGPSQVFGDDDVIADRCHKASLWCTKNDSFVYTMTKVDFIKFFKQ